MQVSKNLEMIYEILIVIDVEKLLSTITTKDELVITNLKTLLLGPCLDVGKFVMVQDIYIVVVERFIDKAT